MKDLGLKSLINKKISSINRISVVEEGEKYLIDDTFVLEVDETSELFQILVEDNRLSIFKIKEINDSKILGEFLSKEYLTFLKHKQVNLYSDNIFSITNFVVSSSGYLLGSKVLCTNGEFIFGFCYGFDEIELIKSHDEFAKMIKSHSDNDIKNILLK